MVARDDFLEAVDADENELFLKLIKRHHARTDPMDIDEVLASLERKQLIEVWQKLQVRCTKTLLSFNTETDGEEQEKELANASKILQGIVMIAMATTQMEDLVVFPELLETVVVLHGIVMSLPESEVKLMTSIARLCETWWKAGLDGRNDVTDQTLLWLLTNTCHNKATIADVKRVCGMREALVHVDIDSESIAPLKAALLTVLISPNYIKLDEGRRFLAFLFTLKPSFVEELHKTIKNQLPQSKKSLQTFYGEIYFRAWRTAEGATKQKIEQFCIQDLMYLGIHAPRGSRQSLASVLREVLAYIHKQKTHPGVDEMLLRLYEPILWRSLKVANPHVRANAGGLLVDVFPLHDPTGKSADEDKLLQQQIDILQTMLYDPNVTVRVVLVRGVSAIICDYWEFLPSPTIRWFINHLVADLAWDGASPEVRASVLQGMGRILDNHLSHPLLKVLLPELRNLLHDTAEMVRVAFLQLLIKVKTIRSIQFWSIAPTEHLLARLEEDTPGGCVMRRIISLISNSFLPVDKPVDVQLERCIALIQMNGGAARWFYRYTHEKVPLVNTVKFMTAICQCVLLCVRREHGTPDANSSCASATSCDDTSSDEEDEKENAANVTDSGSSLSMTDTEVMRGLLEVAVILWEGIKHRLHKPGNADLKERLQMRYSQALPEFYSAFTDPSISASLVLLAAFLPAKTIPTYSRTMLSKLRAMPDDVDVESYSPMLEAMCKWGKAADVLTLITEWLEAALSIDEANSTLNKSRKKSKVMFAEPVVPRPQLSLLYMRYMIRHTQCQNILLTKHRHHVANVAQVLGTITNMIEQRLASAEPLGEHMSDAFLLEGFDVYCRLEVLLNNPDEAGKDVVAVMEHLLTWAETELLIYLKHKRLTKRRLLNQTNMTLLADSLDTTMSTTMAFNATMNTTIGGTKRMAAEAHSPATVQLATKLVKTLLEITGNMLLVGVADRELLLQLAVFSEALFKTDECGVFVAQLTSLIYQMTEISSSWEHQEDEGVSSPTDVVTSVIIKMVRMFSAFTRNKKEQAERVLPGIKSSMGQILQLHHSRTGQPDSPCDLTVMETITAVIITEMTDTITKEPECEPCANLTSLPLLTGFLMGAMGRRRNLNCLLVAQIHASVNADVGQTLEGLMAVLHILHTLSISMPHGTSLKECLTGVQTHLEGIVISEELSEDNPYRCLHTAAKKMLADSMMRAGIVA